jgi:hypothetical protein
VVAVVAEVVADIPIPEQMNAAVADGVAVAPFADQKNIAQVG